MHVALYLPNVIGYCRLVILIWSMQYAFQEPRLYLGGYFVSAALGKKEYSSDAMGFITRDRWN